jgi:hypothetical protein
MPKAKLTYDWAVVETLALPFTLLLQVIDEMSMIEPCWLDYLDVMVGSCRVALFNFIRCMSWFSCDACFDFIACGCIEPVRPGGYDQACKSEWRLMICSITIANVFLQVRQIKGVADKAFGGLQLIVSGEQSLSVTGIF